MKKHFFFFLFALMLINSVKAQTTYLLNSSTSGSTVTTCNGTLYDSGGNSGNYGNNENYTITVCATSGCMVATFNNFRTQTGNDVLYVYDGSSTSAPLIGNFSGSTVPAAITASVGCLTFKFVSSNSKNYSGWSISLTCGTCSNIYNMVTGTQNVCDASFYDSGGSGSNYSNNSTLTETFCSSNSTCLEVVFTAFNTQSNKDTLTIFDGSSTSATRIGVWSGNSLPPKITSSTGCLTFRFKSDGSTTNTGWAAIISCVPCPTAPSGSATYTHPTTGIAGSFVGSVMVNTCGGTYTDNGGTSSNYSNSIGNIYRTFCPNTPGNALRATFWSLNTESGQDQLSILNGATQNSPSLGTWSGNYSTYQACVAAGMGPYIATDQSGCLTFRFNSNGSTNAAGWVATFDCVPFPSAPTGTENFDCVRASVVCNNQSLSDASVGPGLTSDITSGCIPTENYTNWFALKVASSGKLGFTLVPNTSTDDYDFAFFGPNPGCGTLGSPLRCSYAGNQSSWPNTGMNSSMNLSFNSGGSNNGSDLTEGAGGNGYTDEVVVNEGETYLLMISKWSPGGNGFNLNWILSNGASLDCNAPLPIELLSFTGEPENSAVRLNWITASEINNDYFDIERSKDGKEFVSIQKVRGSGTTTNMMTYGITDYEPLQGRSFYRLKQVDYDGKFTYSDIVPVKFSSSRQLCTIQPNPAVENAEVVLYSPEEKNIAFRVVNSFGALVYEKPWDVHEGINRFVLDVAEFAKGIYFVTLENGTEVNKLRLVKN